MVLSSHQDVTDNITLWCVDQALSQIYCQDIQATTTLIRASIGQLVHIPANTQQND